MYEKVKAMCLLALSLVLAGMCLAFTPVSAMAQAIQVDVPLHKSKIISVPKSVARVSVGAPEVADILITNPRQVYVVGKALGTTNVVLWDSQDTSFATYDINVIHDLNTLKAKLHMLFPNESPEVFSSQEHLVVSGQVSNIVNMDAIAEVSKSFSPDGKMMNLMQVGGVQQVLLEVKVAELSRTVAKRLGVNLIALRPGSSETRIGVVNGGASFPDALTPEGLRVPIVGGGPLNGTEDPVGPVVDEFAPTQPAIDGTGLFLSYLDPSFFFRTVIDAAKEEGLAKILAEPTLVSLSGQEAQFLSGGEFPIPVAEDRGTISVEFKEFGVGLKFVPVVLDANHISLKLNVSVSQLTTANSVIANVETTNAVFAIPALTVRSARSTVELAPGQTIGIAGLISDNLRDAVNKFPGLGDIPVLGQLFRSQEFQKDQTELVIFVTPRLAQPIMPDQIRLPTDGLVEPSDLEYYILGRQTGKRPKQASLQASDLTSGTGIAFGHDIGGGINE